MIFITALAFFGAFAGTAATAQNGFRHFEARHTHPICLTPDQTRLLALNSPDARLSVFDVSGGRDSRPVLIAEIPVGLEPVSVRARTDDEVWVVNELSDSVSIVSLSRGVTRATLACPDEPADVAFAGGKAFVSCARNGLLRVFDVETLAEISVIPLTGHYPRALTVNADGTKVFCAFQLSGNGTTVLPPELAPPPPLPTNASLPPAPKTALIVPATDPRVGYKILDHDVAEISVTGLRVTSYFSKVGTVLFSVAVQPGTQNLWIANTEAHNLIRFEPNLKGRFADNRLTRLDLSDGSAVAFDLNVQIEGDVPVPVVASNALAQPTAVVFSTNGIHCWITAFGSDRVARWDAMKETVLERIDVRLPVPGQTNDSRAMRGPRGLAWQEGQGRLYVLNKLSNTITLIDTDGGGVLEELAVGTVDPTPAAVREGRGFLFDARLSGNGASSCATCHIDADRDDLAWDLGDPTGEMTKVIGANLAAHDLRPREREMHPMKGPMMTQTLRGLEPNQLLHWRGDRPTLRHFNPTFRDLMAGELVSDADMDAMKTYLDSLRHHPNPNRSLDNSLPARFGAGDPTRGRSLFVTHVNHCGVCHALPSGSDNNVDDLRNFGGLQPIKTPPFQTLYQRALLDTRAGATNVSGFGLGHNGAGSKHFLPTVHFYELDELFGQDFADVTAFLMCFETGTASAVGKSVTVTADAASQMGLLSSLTALEAPALTNHCDLVARGRVGGAWRQFMFDRATQRYLPDRVAEPPLSRPQLLAALQEGDAITFLAVLPGDGSRYGGDRDADGVLDGDAIRPALHATIASDRIHLRWPQTHRGWLLERAPTATGPWSLFSEAPAQGNDFLQVEATTDEAQAYFRLRRSW